MINKMMPQNMMQPMTPASENSGIASGMMPESSQQEGMQIMQQMAGQMEQVYNGLDSAEDIEDVINAILLSANIKKNLIINVCSGKSQKTHELVKKIFKILNCRTKLISVKRDKTKSKELIKMVGNNKKARTSLKWKPKISLELGIKNTIEWLKENKSVSRQLNYE